MKKIIYTVFVLFLFIGCGGDSDSAEEVVTVIEEVEEKNVTIVEEIEEKPSGSFSPS